MRPSPPNLSCCQGASGCRADAGRRAGDDGDLGRRAVAGHLGSGLRNLSAEAVKGDGVRLGTAALAGIEPVDGRDLSRGELEVEHVEVLSDALRLCWLAGDT